MRIVYYTCGNLRRGSTRLRAIVPGRYLRTLGHEVLFNPPRITKTDVVVFQKVADRAALMTAYAQRGAYVVMDVSDFGQYPAKLAAITVVGTRALQAWYPNSTIIPDVLDLTPGAHARALHEDVLRKLVWFGTGENVPQAKAVARACVRMNLPLTMITNTLKILPGTTHRRWQLTTIDARLPEYDLAVCPFLLNDADGFKSPRSQAYLECKSVNRPLKAWALGLPVAGSPIPSYVECGVQHLAATVEEWIQTIERMKSRGVREEDARRGAKLVEAYRVEVVAQQWLRLFQRLSAVGPVTEVQTVGVVPLDAVVPNTETPGDIVEG